MSRRPPKGLAFLAEDRPAEAFQQLDAVLQVVHVRHWAVLGLVAATLAGCAVFSWFYKAPLKVDGRGILLARYADGADSLLQVTAPASGRIKRVLVAIEAEVAPGQVLAEIDQKDLEDQIKEAEAEVERLKVEDAELTRYDAAEADSHAASLGRLETALKRNLALDQGRLVVNRQVEAGDRSLKERRLLSVGDALKTRAEADAVESKVGATQAQLYELGYERLKDETTRGRDRLKRSLGLRAAGTKLALLRDRLERDRWVVSAYAGKVVDLMLTPHALVEKGAPAALLEPPVQGQPPLEAIVFVPAGLGKKVAVGDDVEIAPDTVRRQEHGFVRGRVRSASEIPATEMAMLAELKHKTLVASFLEQYAGQVLLSVHVDLPEGSPRPGAAPRANRLDWSSASGPSQRVSTGTLCSAEVVVERRPLAVLVMPWLKQLVGVY
jgi:HlyD family secretion protein